MSKNINIGGSKPETVTYSGGSFEKMKCSINLTQLGINVPQELIDSKGYLYAGKNGTLLFFDGTNRKSVGKFGDTIDFAVYDKNASDNAGVPQATQNTNPYANNAQGGSQQASVDTIEYPEEDINPEDIPF